MPTLDEFDKAVEAMKREIIETMAPKDWKKDLENIVVDVYPDEAERDNLLRTLEIMCTI